MAKPKDSPPPTLPPSALSRPGHGLTGSDAVAKRATQSVKVFRTMLPGLTGFARVLTRRDDVRVQIGTSSCTDGKTIYILPPIELGDVRQHDRGACDKRDENGVQRCGACKRREDVLITLYHEIAHIAFDSFESMDDAERITILKRVLDELKIADGTDRASKIARALEQRDPRSYVAAAGLISPFLHGVVNALEDVRVNIEMYKARPGTLNMFKAQTHRVFNDGIDDGVEMRKWCDMPVNAQAIVGLLAKAAKYDYEGWFSPEIEEMLGDDELGLLLARMSTVRSVKGVYELAIPVLERIRQLGYCLAPDDIEDDPEPEPEPEEADEHDDEEGEADAEQDDGRHENDGAGDDDPEGDQDDSDRGDEDSNAGTETDDSPAPSTDADTEPDDTAEPTTTDDTAEPDAGTTAEPADAGTEPDDTAEPTADDTAEPADADTSSDSDDDDDCPGDGTDADEQGDAGDSGDGEPDEATGDDEPGDGGSSDGDDDDGTDVNEGADGGLSTDSQNGMPGDDAEGEAADDDGSATDDSGLTTGDAGGSDGAEQGDETDDGQSSDSEYKEGDGEQSMAGEPDPDGGAEGPGQPGAPDLERDGDADLVEKALRVFGGHAADGDTPGNQESHEGDPDDDDADDVYEDVDDDVASFEVGRAVMQGEHFDRPSKNVFGVRVHHYNQRDHVTMYGGKEADWADSQGPFHGAWYYNAAFGEGSPSCQSYGVAMETKTPESVLAGPLMEMRVTFAKNRKAASQRNLKSGNRIDGRVLGRRLATEDPRLFHKRKHPGKKDYFVLIGLDCSGSQMGSNMRATKMAALAQIELCQRTGVAFAVYAHTAMYASEDTPRAHNGGYMMDLDIYVIKDEHEPWDSKARARLADLGPSGANLDGHTLEFYRKRCMESSATDKIIMYYTDGRMPAENYDEELEILQENITKCKTQQITLMGVGIGTDSPSDHGLDTVQVDGPGDLRKVVKHLGKRLGLGG